MSRNALPTKPPSRGRILPMSGTERTYTDFTFGTRTGVDNNNCYGYAIDRFRETGNVKLQPGNVAKLGGDVDLSSCRNVMDRTKADLVGRAYPEKAEKACRPGYHKVMAFLAKDTDYHWYRQHRNALVRLSDKLRSIAALARALGVKPKQIYSPTSRPKPGDTVLVRDAGLWSHKQGLATGPLLKDSCDKAIKDPRAACRTYPNGLDYKDYCGAMCVRGITRQTRNTSANSRSRNVG